MLTRFGLKDCSSGYRPVAKKTSLISHSALRIILKLRKKKGSLHIGRRSPMYAHNYKTIYGVINFGVIFKIMTQYDLKFMKVTHRRNASFRFVMSFFEK